MRNHCLTCIILLQKPQRVWRSISSPGKFSGRSPGANGSSYAADALGSENSGDEDLDSINLGGGELGEENRSDEDMGDEEIDFGDDNSDFGDDDDDMEDLAMIQHGMMMPVGMEMIVPVGMEMIVWWVLRRCQNLIAKLWAFEDRYMSSPDS